jgi:hypothetical protein
MAEIMNYIYATVFGFYFIDKNIIDLTIANYGIIVTFLCLNSHVQGARSPQLAGNTPKQLSDELV